MIHCSSFSAVSETVNVLLTLGPDGVMRAWDDRAHDDIADDLDFYLNEEEDYPLFAGYFSLRLENIWIARRVSPPDDAEPAEKFILDSIVGEDDTCEFPMRSPLEASLYSQKPTGTVPRSIPSSYSKAN
ncbi:hypothetical protein MSAN_00281400 [Mycena sanguinolenta]|uniref:Uncharacterized protein n=1 Tax=Mycena sanguinolenta TaxID=230812 RepID=A0A8H6Z7K8_9AGAR|nr:hypothetical protein MSAN_00281400 [Mycena sanguinolenta]